MATHATTTNTKRYMTITTILVSFSFVLQLIAFVTPGWIVMIVRNTFLYIGLWYTRICNDSEACDIIMNADFLKLGSMRGLNEIKVYQGLATSALIMSFIAVMLFGYVLFSFRRSINLPGRIVPFGGFLIFFSGILEVACAGKCADGLRMVNDYGEIVKIKLTLEFPYSVLIGGIGGLVGITSVAVLFFSGAWSISQSITSGENCANTPTVYFHNQDYYTNTVGESHDTPKQDNCIDILSS